MRRLLVLFVLLTCATTAVAQLSVTASLGSFHVDRSAGYNEFNPGVGIEYDVRGRFAVTVGTYYNSVRRQTWYAGVRVHAFEWNDLRFGAMVGAATGYHEIRTSRRVVPMTDDEIMADPLRSRYPDAPWVKAIPKERKIRNVLPMAMLYAEHNVRERASMRVTLLPHRRAGLVGLQIVRRF